MKLPVILNYHPDKFSLRQAAEKAKSDGKTEEFLLLPNGARVQVQMVIAEDEEDEEAEANEGDENQAKGKAAYAARSLEECCGSS